MKKFVHKRCAICRAPISPRNRLCGPCVDIWGEHVKEPWLMAMFAIEEHNFLYELNMPELLPLDKAYSLTSKPPRKL